MAELEKITDANWRDFVSHSRAVLMVAESACPACKAWTDELSNALESDESLGHVRYGKVLLDAEDTKDYREANKEWLDIIDGIPFNAIFTGGEPRASFYGGGIGRLRKRLERLAGEQS